MNDTAPLLTLATDGTGRAAQVRGGAVPAHPGADGARLETLLAVRAQLGDGPDTQITTRLPLPAALGLEPADHLLPASLALCEGITGDLASFGWRLGVGAGSAWRRAEDLRDEMADAARIAYLGYEGTVQVSVLGPLSLAASTWTAAGERAVADRGLLRELPAMLGAGTAAHIARLREHLPHARLHLLVLEPAADALLTGRLRPASGRGTLPALPAPELGPRWADLLSALQDTVPTGTLTLAPGSHAALLQAAWHAGARRLAISPERLGPLASRTSRAAWEETAGLRDRGAALEALLDARRAEGALTALLRATGELGLAPHELTGLVLLASRIPALTRAPGAGALQGASDPAHERALDHLLTGEDIDLLRRAAVHLAERIAR